MNRIELLASLSSGANTLCDVGCDHAYVLVEALKKYDCKRGIAADIAAGPLSAARETIGSARLTDRIDVVLSDGFKDIGIPFDTAVVAGMGGNLIVKILSDSYLKIKNKKLILEPNNDQKIVRQFLASHGFSITDEYSIIDMGKYYEIIVAKEGNETYTEDEITYGPILLKKKEDAFIYHYEQKKEMLLHVIDSIKNPILKKEKEEELSKIESILKKD